MIRIFFKNAKSSKESANYADFTCSGWSVCDNLLCLHGSEKMVYFPLTNIEYFMEI